MILSNGGFGPFQILRRACLTPGDARSPPTAPKTAPKTIAVHILRLEKIMKMIKLKRRKVKMFW